MRKQLLTTIATALLALINSAPAATATPIPLDLCEYFPDHPMCWKFRTELDPTNPVEVAGLEIEVSGKVNNSGDQSAEVTVRYKF